MLQGAMGVGKSYAMTTLYTQVYPPFSPPHLRALLTPQVMTTHSAPGLARLHVIHLMPILSWQGLFPLGMFIKIDPDLIKAELPELRGYKSHDVSPPV